MNQGAGVVQVYDMLPVISVSQQSWMWVCVYGVYVFVFVLVFVLVCERAWLISGLRGPCARHKVSLLPEFWDEHGGWGEGARGNTSLVE